MCLLLYLQVKIKYGEERHYCPSEPPCSLPFLEPYEEHDFLYHAKKTAALICGCGYGHILAHKFVQHVKDIHGVQLTTSEAAERYFWHNLVEFERVYGCHRNSKRVKCTFRSPIEHLMLNVHACVTDHNPLHILDTTSLCVCCPSGRGPRLGSLNRKVRGPNGRRPVIRDRDRLRDTGVLERGREADPDRNPDSRIRHDSAPQYRHLNIRSDNPEEMYAKLRSGMNNPTPQFIKNSHARRNALDVM